MLKTAAIQADCRSRRSTRSAPRSSPTARNSSRSLTEPFYGANRPGSKVSQGVKDSFWLQGMQAGFKAAYDCIRVFRDGFHRRPEDVRRTDLDYPW